MNFLWNKKVYVSSSYVRHAEDKYIRDLLIHSDTRFFALIHIRDLSYFLLLVATRKKKGVGGGWGWGWVVVVLGVVKWGGGG